MLKFKRNDWFHDNSRNWSLPFYLPTSLWIIPLE
nr:MAG TPA: hypothetical protein [Crassvirales sp.]